MVLACCAYGCNEVFVKGGPITFHSFPKNPERRKLWEIKLKRENFKVTNHSRICSKHFTSDCFDTRKFGGTWLKSDAVPTIFDFPRHVLKPINTRQPPRKRRKSSDDISVDCQNQGSSVDTPKRRKSSDDISVDCQNEGSSVDTPKQKKKKRLVYLGDFDEKDVTSPTKAKKVLKISQRQVAHYKKKVKNLCRKNRRLKKRVESLNNMLSELQEKRLISDEATSVLKLSLPGSAAELINRMEFGGSRDKYPPELRSFALTLNFYSAKAYNYLRKTFQCNLPHPTTLRKWYQCIDGSAGFTNEAFAALKVKAQEAELKNSSVKCCLIIDEMSIRNHVEWDRKKFSGYVDLGTDIDDDQLPHAKDALVFMVNALNANWKLPISYFLINGLASSERANLIKEALRRIHETGVDVVSLTFDGTSTNLATANILGANLVATNIVNFFPHPVTSRPVFIIMDPSHMLKLVRNCLASKGSIYDTNMGLINWNFITDLEKIQKEEGLHLATKLRARHVQWFNEKMKVKLAAQVLSQSVADALRYLAHDLKHPKFQGCDATINFLQTFNNLFDLLNSRNLLAKGYKAPFNAHNNESFVSFLEETEAYIRGLKTSKNGESILSSNRKTGFLGFLISMKSVRSLYVSVCDNSVMKFLLTYKLSQDHLELFFSAIRSKGGHNNNPTAKQFKAAYVRLLAHHEIMTSDSANCAILDATNVINLESSTNIYLQSINATDVNLHDSTHFHNVESVSEDHSYMSSGLRQLSEYVNDVSGYVAGFVVKKLKSTLKCPDCTSAVLEGSQNVSKLISRRNCGGLIIPSEDVTSVCKFGEKVFRIANASGKLKRKNIMNLLIVHGLNEIESKNPNVFGGLTDHAFHHAPLDNHRIFLIKAIFYEYFKIRLTHVGKSITEELQSNKIRSINSKMTLFKGQ